MNNFFTQLKNKARETRLVSDEKQAMRVRLYNYLEQNPIGTFEAPAKIPKPMPSMYYFFSPRFMVPIALLLVVGLSGGTAFAAQSALPGNPLYAIKINVNEAVQTALATTPQAKAEVNAALATTRLEEAETLASAGTLDASTTAELAANFSEHAQAAQDNTADIGASNPGAAAQLGAQFNGTLAAHSAILAQIGDDSSSSEIMYNSNALAMAVDAKAPAPEAIAAPVADVSHTDTMKVRTFATAAPQIEVGSLATGTGTSSPARISAPYPEDAAITASLGTEASTSIAAALQDFAALEPLLDATTSSQIAAQLGIVQDKYAAGDFAAAIRLSVTLDAYLKAGKKFNLDLLTGLITDHNETKLQTSAPDTRAK